MSNSLAYADRPHVVVVGAGIGGLSAALRLVSCGLQVTICERAEAPGGKMRQVPSCAGPVDAGPTVLTLRHVFDDLFAAAGARLAEHATLVPQPLLARHFWPDGSHLDLYSDRQKSVEAVAAFGGARLAAEFSGFCDRAHALFDGLDDAMMQNPAPSPVGVALSVLKRPSLWRHLARPGSLAKALEARFSDPRMAQLFGRYATYIGGAPDKVPALLALIWQAEASGVWCLPNGLSSLARTVCELAVEKGARLRTRAHVAEIMTYSGRAAGVVLEGGERIGADVVLFAGDPRAVATGALGGGVRGAVDAKPLARRSLSARVWSFGATLNNDPGLAHHNVFFADQPGSEFADLAAGRMPRDPTIYVCAEDRLTNAGVAGPERFEIILNAAPLDGTEQAVSDEEEFAQCRQLTFQKLTRFGLRFEEQPGRSAVTLPSDFAQMFPATAGAIYGQSPHGTMAAFRRPKARTRMKGLYLAGGGAHPGAGVPMAALSGKHAAEAILTDLASMSASARTVTRGGTLTGSRPMANAASRSSPS